MGFFVFASSLFLLLLSARFSLCLAVASPFFFRHETPTTCDVRGFQRTFEILTCLVKCLLVDVIRGSRAYLAP